ncbi:MAG: LysM peptidoglycan-binding domain-containing protein [Methyloprofundus sp.]|nr:LysM peptidoglycan-binding domain-containing protein [Methyloprofundus sp.]
MKYFNLPFFIFLILAISLSACSPKKIRSRSVTQNPAIITAAPQPSSLSEDFPAETSPQTLDSWQYLISMFELSTESNPRIDRELKWFLAHPKSINTFQARAEPYLYNIIEEVKAQNLPAEFALLPAIESGYRAHAYSHSGAAGLWQFIPSTGRAFKLKQNWWYDGRRDVHASTKAATRYLKQLAKRFDGDWLLALAAYNAGGGNVNKAVRRNRKADKPTDYWSLSLPNETLYYVPKLLALAKLFANAERYGITLRKLEHKPYFSIVNIGSQLDLAKAAELSAMSIDDIFQLNPGFNRGFTPPKGPHHLLIPIDKVSQFEENLALLPDSQRVKWQRHKIKTGESLSVIAQHYKVKSSILRSVNQIKNNNIRAGKTLYIPISQLNAKHNPFIHANLTNPNNKYPTYTVKSGDSLWSIARKFDLHSKDIARWNKISIKAPLRLGQKLAIKQKTSYTQNISATRAATIQKIHYTVRSGDSLSTISAKFNVHVADLRKWNKHKLSKYLKPGQKLMLKVDTTKPST